MEGLVSGLRAHVQRSGGVGVGGGLRDVQHQLRWRRLRRESPAGEGVPQLRQPRLRPLAAEVQPPHGASPSTRTAQHVRESARVHDEIELAPTVLGLPVIELWSRAVLRTGKYRLSR